MTYFNKIKFGDEFQPCVIHWDQKEVLEKGLSDDEVKAQNVFLCLFELLSNYANS